MYTQKGITLVTLSITIVVMIILTFTITVNIEQYRNQKIKSNFETDMLILSEEINQYYAREKELPVINKFTNIDMLDGIKNINDNNEYYVIHIDQLDININLNYGKDYYTIRNMNIEEEITNLLDVYIINKQSNTIYYPKGVMYDGSVHYRLPQTFSNIETVDDIRLKLKVGDYVKYTPTTKSFVMEAEETGYSVEQTFSTGDYTGLWQVIYNDQVNGVQLISADSVGDLYLKGTNGYNKVLTTLNKFCSNYENETYTVTGSGRTVGSNMTNPNEDTKETESLVFKTDTGLLIGDTRYDTADIQAMKKATNQNSEGIQAIGKYYWLPSRYVFKTSDVGYFSIYTIANDGDLEYRRMKDIYVNNKEFDHEYAYGVRPIVKIKDRIRATSGLGTSLSPYILEQ